VQKALDSALGHRGAKSIGLLSYGRCTRACRSPKAVWTVQRQPQRVPLMRLMLKCKIDNMVLGGMLRSLRRQTGYIQSVD